VQSVTPDTTRRVTTTAVSGLGRRRRAVVRGFVGGSVVARAAANRAGHDRPRPGLLDTIASTVMRRSAGHAALSDDDAAERDRIGAALARNNGNQTRAAGELGFSLRKLVYLMTRYDLPRPCKKKS
jgi:transcriptional regulator with GAF, ATPase, and Fis domain